MTAFELLSVIFLAIGDGCCMLILEITLQLQMTVSLVLLIIGPFSSTNAHLYCTSNLNSNCPLLKYCDIQLIAPLFILNAFTTVCRLKFSYFSPL